MVGESNRLARAHILAFPNWPGPLTLLVAPPKAGKSHLARIWTERADAVEVTPASAEQVATEGGVRPVLVEDADRSGYGEAGLFHLLNQSMRERRPVLLTARSHISEWPFATDDLKSRARLATLVTMSAADDILLSHMLVKLFGDRQVAVDPRTIGYIVSRMERSAEEAVALVELMDAIALARGTAITRGVAAQALAERGSANGQIQLRLDLEGEDDE